MIRPYFRNLINDHKPIMESNNTKTNNNTNNNKKNNTNNDTNTTTTHSNRVEWKIQLIIKNNFSSVKDFEDT